MIKYWTKTENEPIRHAECNGVAFTARPWQSYFGKKANRTAIVGQVLLTWRVHIMETLANGKSKLIGQERFANRDDAFRWAVTILKG